jgi:hypothetical protein
VALGGWLAVSMGSRRSTGPQKETTQVPPAAAATTGGSDADPSVVPLVPRAAASGRTPPQSADPIPSIHSILVGPGRRLAILNGAIVGEGDQVGRRRVSRIEQNAVVLRDASGEEIRVAVPRLKPGT